MKRIIKSLFSLFLALSLLLTMADFKSYAAEENLSEETNVKEESENEPNDIDLEEEQSLKGVGLNVAYHSQADIQAFFNQHPFRTDDPVSFSKEPSFSEPYSVGVLDTGTRTRGLNVINTIRYIAGLNANVTYDTNYEYKVSAGSFLNKLNNDLDHYPVRPSVLNNSKYDGLVSAGQEGARSANIAWNHKNLNSAIIYGWMDDGDAYNIDRLGHRRWILNPKMGKTGFGVAGAYSSMYSMDYSGASLAKYVAWPAQNTPAEFFDWDAPWSLSLDTNINADSCKVEVVRKKDNKKWTLFKGSTEGYFNVNTLENGSMIGQAGSCIIFKPDARTLGKVSPGEQFNVKITFSNGIPTQEISYPVNFFSLDFSAAPRAISSCDVTMASTCMGYGGKSKEPEIALLADNKTLTKGTDYTVSYSKDTKTGIVKANVSGYGKYYGSETFTIYPIIYKNVEGAKNTNPLYAVDNARNISLSSITKAGYRFDDWYTDSSFKNWSANRFSVYGKPVTLYAKWTPNKYYIEFDGNKASSGKMTYTDYIKYGSDFKLPANQFKKKGYKFAGWNTRKDGKGKSYKNNAIVKNLSTKDWGRAMLYAKWTPIKYTVKYNANGGKGKTIKSTSMTYGKKKALSKNTYTKKGYKFKGWATSKVNAKKGKVKYKNKVSVKNLTTKNNAQITLYAVWTKK